MSSWNIILCGHLPSTIVMCVPDPSKWTVSDLKQEVIKRVPKATANDIALYVGKDEIPEGKPLSECSGVRNGTALLVSIKPFIINVYCPDFDVTVAIEVPLLEFDWWKVSIVLEAIHFKLGIKAESAKDDILAYNGNSLSDPTSSISSIPDISNHCLMTYTRLNKRVLSTPQSIVKEDILLPENIDLGFAKSHCFYNRDTSTWENHRWLSDWHIIVQQLDGSQTTVLLPDPHKMTVISLRETVEKVLSVPTHQQKLLLGDSHTVLEDWKLNGYITYVEILVNDYSSFCDGAKLYLIQLTEGIRVNVLKSPQKEQKFASLSYINIANPSICTIKKLVGIMTKITGKYNSLIYLVDSTKSVLSSDEPVSSVEWITDGCTLTLHEYNYNSSSST